MTGTDVITNRARLLMDDESKNKWDDDDLMRYLNDGVLKITTDRPEALLTSRQVSGTTTEVTSLGDTVSIGDRYREPLAHYVASRALAEEAQDKRDLARANSLYNIFLKQAGLSENYKSRG